MACYINPPNETKEAFLQRVGKVIDPVTSLEGFQGDTRLAVWKHNVFFTSAGVPVSDRDLEGFTSPDDLRLTLFYAVPLAELQAVVMEDDWKTLTSDAEGA